MTLKILKMLLLLFLLPTLPACQGNAASPQAAATRALMEGSTKGMVVDQMTLEVSQTLDIDPNQSIVVLAFQAADSRHGPVTCLYTYQTLRRWYGWTAANGGGSCRPDIPEQQQEFNIFSGHYSGALPKDPGYTQVYGYIDNPHIVKVRITWDDNQVTEATVINGTAISVRSGGWMMKFAEGLDQQDQVIETVTAGPRSMRPVDRDYLRF